MELLKRSETPLISKVNRDEFIEASEVAFDCIFDGTSRFYPWEKPKTIPKKFNIGLIIGTSGSGKSKMLLDFGVEEDILWDNNKAIISHFDNPEDGINKLSSVGFNSIPSWYKPFKVLSNGEKFRANLARKIKNGAVIDEFTSVIDRTVAKASSVSLSRYIKSNNIENVVLASCHTDIVDWLEPDWVLNTNTGEFITDFFLSDQKLKSKYTTQNMIIGNCLKHITI